MRVFVRLAFAVVMASPAAPAADDQSPLATKKEINGLERDSKNCRSAEDAVLLYDEFLATHTLTPSQTEQVEVRRRRWRERAEAGLVRLGTRWVTVEQRQEAAEEARSLIDQAWPLIKVGDYRGSQELLVKASNIDRNAILADYTLGLLNSVMLNHPPTATKHFRRVLSRSPGHFGALNNLAVAEAKARKIKAAYTHWA